MLVSDKEKKPDKINRNTNAISMMCNGKSSKEHLYKVMKMIQADNSACANTVSVSILNSNKRLSIRK
jgi:hypothetical protein